MKKLTFFALVWLLLAVSILPISAATPNDLTVLADYADEDVQMFVAFRTDAGFIETLDGLIGRIAEKIPGGGQVPNASDSLNQAAAMIEPGRNFQRVFRSWLGETGALFLADIQSGKSPIVIFSVTDTQQAEAFLDNVTSSEAIGADYTKSRRRNNITYTPNNRFNPTYRLTDVAMLIYTDAPDGLVVRNATSLADSRRFQDALARLPGNDYSILAYLDVFPSFAALAPMMNQQMQRSGLNLFDFEALLSSMGPQIFGITLQESRALTVDIAQFITDTAAYERAVGMSFTDRAALNLEFTQHIPADAALVAHDQNLGQSLLLSLAFLEHLGEQLDAHYDTPDIRSDQISALLLDDVVTFMRLTFKGLSGQTLEDAVGWMTGNYATYLSLGVADNLPTFDAGLIIEKTDSAAAEAFFAGQKLLLRDLNIYYAEEENTLLIPGIRQIAESFLPEEMANLPLLDNLELVMGMNDAVLTFGTRPATDLVLSGAAGLDADATFAAAADYFLPNTESLLYIQFAPLVDLAEFAGENGSRDAQQWALVLSLVESASITSTTTPERRGLTSVARLVLTLAE